MEKKREMLHYLCRRQNEPRQPPSSFLSSSSSSPPSLAAMHSTSNPGCNRRCSRGKSSEKTIRATVLLSLPPLPLVLAFPRGEEEFFQRAASNLSRDCFVPFLPPIRAMPRNAFYSLRGSARVSRRRLHGCIYITCSSVDISLFFFLFRFFFGMVSFGIWEGWFHRDARRLIELLPLSRTFSMDVARCVRWPTIGSRDLVQNFSLSFLLFFS